MDTTRRDVMRASAGLALLASQSAFAQRPQAVPAKAPPPPVRKGRIEKMFRSPEGYPNALSIAPEGWWIGEQKSDHACLVDRNGKLLKTVNTESKNTSGMAFGAGHLDGRQHRA